MSFTLNPTRSRLGKWKRPLLIIVGVFLCLLVCALPWLSSFPSLVSERIALALAQQRWATQSVEHYQLVISYSVGCLSDIEVQDEQVVQVIQDGCRGIARPVSQLFDLIDRTLGMCAPAGCHCDGYIVMTATYDAQFGYPNQITSYLDEDSLYQLPGELLHFLTTGGWCLRQPMPGGTIIIQTFKPLE